MPYILDTGSAFPAFAGPFDTVDDALEVAKVMRLPYPRVAPLTPVRVGVFARTKTGSENHLHRGRKPDSKYTECGRKVSASITLTDVRYPHICARCTSSRRPVWS